MTKSEGKVSEISVFVFYTRPVEMKSTLQANETLVENTLAVGWRQHGRADVLHCFGRAGKETYRLIISPPHLVLYGRLFG